MSNPALATNGRFCAHATGLRHTGLLLLALCLGTAATAHPPAAPQQVDPHRNEVGFFDIHVCNWPNRSLFFMALFSTERFDEVESVEILAPDQTRIGYLDTSKYRTVQAPGKAVKRVFISQFDIAEQAPDGWYQALVTLKDGSRLPARDFVVVHKMGIASNVNPPPAAENIPLPRDLTWDPVAGAKYYQVFIRDEWEGQIIYESELLTQAKLPLPEGLLAPGGYYSWRIHTRDINESVLLGDFNHGSLSTRSTFSVAED